jgi:cytochrome o ubiquinol oxidase operon protein cyoD
MSTHHHPAHPHHSQASEPGSLRSYLLGYGLSLLTTLFSFWAAMNLGRAALPLIVIAAIVQTAVQFRYFLHLGRSTDRAWLTFGGFSLIVLGILVGGTLWIMHNLMPLHMHSPSVNDLYEHGIMAPQNELK